MLSMRAIAAFFILFLALGGLVYGQDDSLKAREIFIKSRLTVVNYEQEEAKAVPARRTTGTKGAPARRKKPSSVLGLGYNFYLNTDPENSEGRYIHVDPSRTFKSGDQIRMVVETTVDGYLYVFNQTNDGKPVMLFPNYAVFNGDNRIKAHQRYLVPGRTAMEFDENTGTETLTIIVSRRPIQGLPVRQELRNTPKFEISVSTFEVVAPPANVAESKVIEQEGPLPGSAIGLTSRDLKIVPTSSSTPPPDNVVVTVSDNQSQLSARIKLKHR